MATISFFVGWEIKDEKKAEEIINILNNLPTINFEDIGITEKFEKQVDEALKRGENLLNKWKREGIHIKK